MKSFFRRAIEEGQPEGVNIVASGPLADTYAKALNAIYSKDNSEESVSALATETQAADAVMLKQLANVVSGNSYDRPQDQTDIYGVAKINVDDDDILEVANRLAVHPNKTDFILVIDAMDAEIEPIEGNVENKVIDIANATKVASLESLARAYGAQVYSSLGAALEKFKVQK